MFQDELTLAEHKSLLHELQEIVKCPVCLDILQAPVIQCSNGHFICNDCSIHVNNCPVCRGKFISVKNRVLEGILSLIPHRCKHETCEVFVKPGDDHEKWCCFQLTKCKSCEWNGCAKDLFSHVKQHHEQKLIQLNEPMKIQSINQSSACTMALYAQDQFFWVERKNYALSHVCSVRYSLIPNGKISNSFEIQFVMENTQNKLVMSTMLYNDTILNTDTKFNSFSFPSSVFEGFSNENQEIVYKLKLIRLN